ncbi:MAG: hypothetical protein ACPGRR_12395, partial [Pseudoalteromonas shioyasakiensis]
CPELLCEVSSFFGKELTSSGIPSVCSGEGFSWIFCKLGNEVKSTLTYALITFGGSATAGSFKDFPYRVNNSNKTACNEIEMIHAL